jgi:predicted transposase YbfD/YdcC
VRTLISTTILNDYKDWPGLAQVFRLTRERTAAGKKTTEIAYGITSLPRERGDAQRLLSLSRGHWGIENRLHYVRDVTMGEDACRVRKGSAPQILAAVRNVALHILSGVKPKNIAASIRHLAAKPFKAVRLVCPKSEN